jgi:hypothetical protein
MGNAKLHHYVPQLLLRQFSANPKVRNPSLLKLDLKTGRTSATTVKGEAAISHYNRPEEGSGIPPGAIEETLSQVESAAAEPLRKLAEGQHLTVPEQLNVALLAFLQRRRTPLGRAQSVHTLETGAKLLEMERLADPHSVQEAFTQGGEHITLEEAEARGHEVIRQLEGGELKVVPSLNAVLGTMFIGVENIPLLITQRMTWTVLHAQTSNFVISDHPVSLHDPEAGPRRGAGWLSSPKVEVTVPLDKHACLLLTPGPPGIEHIQVASEIVLEANLRTYSAAQWAIYGPTPAAVQHVRAAAKRQRAHVARLTPWPPLIHILDSSRDQAKLSDWKIYPAPRTAKRGRSKQ